MVWPWSSMDKIGKEVLQLLLTTDEPLTTAQMSTVNSKREEKDNGSPTSCLLE